MPVKALILIFANTLFKMSETTLNEKIGKCAKNITEFQIKLAKLAVEKPKMELRVFTETGWQTINFTTTKTPIINMVIHQIRLELLDEMQKEKNLLKQYASEL